MKNISLLLLTMALMASCAQKVTDEKKPLRTILGNLFSTRQQSSLKYVGLLQLKHPALLADATVLKGKTIISEEAKKAILEEQAVVIDDLKNISADIQIITTYKMVINAVAFVAPSEFADEIARIENVSRLMENGHFARPENINLEKKLANVSLLTSKTSLNDHNTVTFIGADKLHKIGISGQKMKVGIIDTGIDYTHTMFAGAGRPEVYESIDPSKATEHFPNAKVVGGMDFAGSEYSSASNDVEKTIPKRDPNPLDEGGHGTHVGGTVSGVGDGKKTYSGVAPDADLYALKVFGAKGSTSDIVVIQALEFAADTTESMNPANRLDVVNLSLGGGYGKPKILYSEAVKNLTRGGTVVVASAGNSGDNPYIVGAPSTAEEAISVAAGIDDMPQNISFPAVEATIGESSLLLEKVEGTISAPAEESKVSGSMVYLGNGADPVAEDVQIKVKGKIALMDRGVNSFVDKLSLAVKLGAVGVVVANNQDGKPIQMGGDKKFDIPAVMITKAAGLQIKEALTNSVAVEFNFSPEKSISKDDLIDTITDFSSRGPRSMDSLIKPEITGPGANIISAAMGTGSGPVQFSGTSMSGPHIAGVMTLLKQAFPALSVAELKAKVLNSSKIMMKNGLHIPVSQQGAGRVQVEQAFKSQIIAMPATLSLGEVLIASNKTIGRTLTLTNFSDKDVVFTTRAISSRNIKVSLPGSFKVKAKSTQKINVSFTLMREASEAAHIEADGFVSFQSGDGEEKINVPFLAVINKVTNIRGSDFLTMTNSEDDKVGAEVRLTLKNSGHNDGDALIFNLLGKDEKKTPVGPLNASTNTSCDLDVAGIRVVDKMVEGTEKKVLQVGIKLFDSLTLWQPCDISLQIDHDNDNVADYELVGIKANYINGVSLGSFASILLDAAKAREIRKDFEDSPATSEENYVPAIIDAAEMKIYDHASVAVIEADISKIKTNKKGNIKVRLAVVNIERDDDDFLGNHKLTWQNINLFENAFAFYGMPEIVTVKANDLEHQFMRRGNGNARLLVLYPHNQRAINEASKDSQAQILVEKFQK